MNSMIKNKWLNFAIVTDVLLVLLLFYISKRFTMIFRPDLSLGWQYCYAYLVLTVFFFYEYDLYDCKENRRQDTVISVLLSVFISNVVIFFCGFIFGWGRFSLWFYVVMIGFSSILLSIYRYFVAVLAIKFKGTQKILVIESKNVTSRLARKIKYSCTNLNTAWYELIDDESESEVKFVLEHEIEKYDSIFISPSLKEEVRVALFNKAILLEKYITVIPTLTRVSIMNSEILQFGDTPTIQVNTLGLTRMQNLVKRVFDILISLIGIIISSPIMLCCAIAIKLDSKGPIIYKQERLTIAKKHFNVYKFRTMRTDAEKFGAVFATENDPRITKVGRILRATRLDELPQLVNIFFGSMSVVGPRPERPIFAEGFIKQVRNYEMRYFVKAGLTGYAQVYGKYNTRASDKILMDLIYVTNYSFWLDIKLILLTIKVMFIKESTQGVDEELDTVLNTEEKEEERRNAINEWNSNQMV